MAGHPASASEPIASIEILPEMRASLVPCPYPCPSWTTASSHSLCLWGQPPAEMTHSNSLRIQSTPFLGMLPCGRSFLISRDGFPSAKQGWKLRAHSSTQGVQASVTATKQQANVRANLTPSASGFPPAAVDGHSPSWIFKAGFATSTVC